MAIVAGTLAVGCSEVLGFKDPTVEGGPGDDAMADAVSCSTCPLGCEPGTTVCREAKLWLFKTPGATLGNAFGGTDTPPNVRGGADGRCLTTYTSMHTMRGCKQSNVHAILHVSSSDSIGLMATKYSIPTNLPVHRADDGAIVFNNWNDLTDPTKSPRVPPTTAPTETEGIVWTGTGGTVTCQNWTSALMADLGTRGYTTRTDVTWLSQDTFRCDRTAGLLCLCWAGD